MPIRYGPSGVLANIPMTDLAPGSPGAVVRTTQSGIVAWSSSPVVNPWGTAEDGDLLVVAPATLLNYEQCFGTVSFGALGTLDLSGNPLRCQTLDLRGAPAGAIAAVGTAGMGGVLGVGGGQGLAAPLGGFGWVHGGGSDGGGGGGGGFGGIASAMPFVGGSFWHATGTLGGAGGNSVTQAGGPITAPDGLRRFPYITADFLNPVNAIHGAFLPIGGGTGGGGGAGDAATAGGGGGAGGGIVAVFARNIIVDATTPVGVVSVLGTAGGPGETIGGAFDGGGGGGGGSGGWIYLVYETITGTAPNALFASGGAGANGGDGGAGRVGGFGGAGGAGGRITLIDAWNGTVAEHVGPAGGASGAPVGNVGGAGGAGGILLHALG